MAQSTDKLLPNPIGKLDGSEVADTEAKAHRDLGDSPALPFKRESQKAEGGRGIQMVDRSSVVAISPAGLGWCTGRLTCRLPARLSFPAQPHQS
jgi:hypothetical protein